VVAEQVVAELAQFLQRTGASAPPPDRGDDPAELPSAARYAPSRRHAAPGA
jgi:hypothetical protein